MAEQWCKELSKEKQLREEQKTHGSDKYRNARNSGVLHAVNGNPELKSNRLVPQFSLSAPEH